MRFFTMSWWSGAGEEVDPDPVADYQVYLAGIADRLPPDLRAVEESISLHDSRLLAIRLNIAESNLILDLINHAGDAGLTLRYAGVEHFASTADPAVGLRGPAGFGDLGYTEVALRPGEIYEHRLLFSSGIELIVACRGFHFQQQQIAVPERKQEGGR